MNTSPSPYLVITDYDDVRELITFAYLKSDGTRESLSIHRSTFASLLTPKAWNKDKLGDPTLPQRNFREAFSKAVSEDPVSWLNTQIAAILKRRVCGK